MTQTRGQSVIVVGAGIGGLAAAIALAQRGFAVRVLERAPAVTEVGAGLQISPNGMAVLRALGVADAVCKPAPRAQAVELWDGLSGRKVLRLDLARHAPDLEYRLVHRADLIAALLEAALDLGVVVETGIAVETVRPGARPAALLVGGSEWDADLVIGADGVRSVVRGVVTQVAEPFFTRQVAWRAVIPNAIGHPDAAWVHMGPGRHMVSYPLHNGAAINIVAVEERDGWAEEGWTHSDDPAAVRAAFSGFTGQAREMLQAIDTVGLWGLFRHPVADRWHAEGVALLGDAAHPTLPFLAQGANMALEDAWVLAACLADGTARDAALARYQARRRDRVVRVIATAQGNAWKYHLRNPILRRAAHLGLSTVGRVAPRAMLGGFDWLYRHDVTRQG